jgi:hypothetical protein
MIDMILKRAVLRSKAAQLFELTSNFAILGLTVSVILDCDPKSLIFCNFKYLGPLHPT